MKPIEDHIRKKLSSQDGLPNLDAEDLWASISAGLPAAGDDALPVAPTTTSGWKNYLPILLGLILLIGGGLFWWLAQPTGEMNDPLATINGNAANTAEPTERPEPGEALGEVASLPPQGTETKQGDPVLARTATLQAAKQTGSLSQPPTPSRAPQTGKELQRGQGQKHAEPDAIDRLPQASDRSKMGVTSSSPQNVTTPANTLLKMRNRLVIDPLKAEVAIPRLNDTRQLPPLTVTLTDQFRSTTRQRISAGLHLGSNMLIRKYTTTGDDTGQQLNRATGQMAGQTIAIDLCYQLNDHLALSTGLDYYRTGNTFQYVSESDTLIPHPTPPNTGMINAVARRSVAHNNQEERINIPLLLAYERKFGDFTAGLGAGLGLNWQTTANGRTLNNRGQIIAYDAPLQQKFFLSWQLQPRLSWQPNPDRPWAFQIRMDAARFELQRSTVTGAQQRGWLFGAGIGLRYGF